MKPIKSICISALLISSCAIGPAMKVEVNSLGSDLNIGKRYIAIPLDTAIKTGTLEYRETADQLHRSLALHGYQRVDALDSADQIIGFGYGVGAPQTLTYNIAIPQYGITGYQSSSTTGSMNVIGNSIYYSEQTRLNPTYGVTGYRNQTSQETVYPRYAYIASFSPKSIERGAPEEIWKVYMNSAGQASNPRVFLPGFFSAGYPVYGKATAGTQTVIVSFGSQLYRYIIGDIDSLSNNTQINHSTSSGRDWNKRKGITSKDTNNK